MENIRYLFIFLQPHLFLLAHTLICVYVWEIQSVFKHLQNSQIGFKNSCETL